MKFILEKIKVMTVRSFFYTNILIRSAKQSGCAVLFSEDMQHTRDIHGLHIVNPFKWLRKEDDQGAPTTSASTKRRRLWKTR